MNFFEMLDSRLDGLLQEFSALAEAALVTRTPFGAIFSSPVVDGLSINSLILCELWLGDGSEEDGQEGE